MNNLNRTLPVLLAAALLGACAASARPTPRPPSEMDPSGQATAIVPTSTSTPQAGYPLQAKPLAELAAFDLAAREGIAVDDIQLLDLQPVEWPDASIGCPAAGTDYAQVLTPGYEITLLAEGTQYSYHTDQGDFVVLCLENGPQPRLVIPIQPGERIMDGIPWMPVDPVPTIPASGDDIVDPAPIK